MNTSRVAAIFGTNHPLIEILDYLLRGVGAIPGTFSAGFSAASVTAPADAAPGDLSSYVITICKGTMSPFEQIAVAFTGRVTADNANYAVLSVDKYHNGAYVSTVGTLSTQLNTYEANTSYDLALTPGVTYADGDVLVLSITKQGAGVSLPVYTISGRLAATHQVPRGAASLVPSPLRARGFFVSVVLRTARPTEDHDVAGSGVVVEDELPSVRDAGRDDRLDFCDFVLSWCRRVVGVRHVGVLEVAGCDDEHRVSPYQQTFGPHLHVPVFVVADQQSSSAGLWQQSLTAFSQVTPVQ